MKNTHQLKTKRSGKQAVAERQKGRREAEPGYSIGARTPFDFRGRNLTPYGGLLPVASLLEKLAFQELVAEYVTMKRATRAMTVYQFVLAIVLGMYIGFARFYQLRFIASDPLFKGILKIESLPPQCTFWRFLAAWHSSAARRLVELQQRMRARVWSAAEVRLARVTLDTDTTVHTFTENKWAGV